MRGCRRPRAVSPALAASTTTCCPSAGTPSATASATAYAARPVGRSGPTPEPPHRRLDLPPEGSGLRALPADSGLVQGFSAYGRGMPVGTAQWSDGRTADFGTLSERLAPPTRAVIGNVPV